MIIKCKMCGGNLRPAENATTCECEYCGSVQTIPKLDNERRLNLYDRANHFRRNNEYDKAMGIFEQILQDDRTDAEAYWSLVLCRYGIEYVEDPASKKRIPTVNRAQFTSIFADEDYKSALQYADAVQKGIYETEAKAIDDIQKGILDISKKEKPFDVFICYKETDAEGKRTPDSVLANDLYHQLTREGFKVFFSRITLEDKLGQQYEPYIFAALNSAKVMVVLGTKPEHFNAVWVKNEWSRYLKLIKNGAEKTLVPAYKDMDPYDLPEEFSHLQAQDMSKLGFMQDLIHGIKKLTQKNEPETAQQVVHASAAASTGAAPLLRRAFIFLEDGDWQNADGYCEKVLDIEPENGRAYLGKLMIELKIPTEERLIQLDEPFDKSSLYQKAFRFGDDALRGMLTEINATIRQRIEHKRQASIYDEACSMLSKAVTIADYKQVVKKLRSIPHFDGVAGKLSECEEKQEAIRNQRYTSAVGLMKNAEENSDQWAKVKVALSNSELDGYRDVEQLRKEAEVCFEKSEIKRLADEMIQRAAERNAAAKKKRNRILGTLISIVIIVIAVYALVEIILPEMKYKNSERLRSIGAYEEAIAAFKELGAYKDSADQIIETYYQQAKERVTKKDYTGAYAIFATIKGYKDVDNLLKNDKNLAAAAVQPKFTVGKYVTYGHYPQTKAGTDNTPIEWLVLARDGNKALLISRYALDCQPYNNSKVDTTWQQCNLRAWLNGRFISKAFTSSELKGILTTNVDNSKSQGYSGYSTKGGNNTKDKVFLLSYAESQKYFKNDNARMCVPTEYAIKQGTLTNSSYQVGGKATCYWWLRSPGIDQRHVFYVFTGGSRLSLGIDHSDSAVRPALWVDLGSGVF